LGEETDDKPSAALVGASDQTVNRLVLTGDVPVRFSRADGAGTAMDPPDIVLMSLGHGSLPPRSEGQSGKVIVPEMLKLSLNNGLDTRGLPRSIHRTFTVFCQTSIAGWSLVGRPNTEARARMDRTDFDRD
jgi:hypothetical protein